jgi:hypothetical protein
VPVPSPAPEEAKETVVVLRAHKFADHYAFFHLLDASARSEVIEDVLAAWGL